MSVKLKDILLSEKRGEAVESSEKVEELLNNGRFYNRKTKLYRASHTKIYRAEIKNIRGDREPLDTPFHIHYIVSSLTKNPEYSEYPARSESKFAATVLDKEYLGQYGSHIYYIFPSSEAKFASRDDDAYYILRSAGRKIPSNTGQLNRYFGLYGDVEEKHKKRRERYPKLVNFANYLSEYKWEKMEDLLKNNKDGVISEAKKLGEEKYGGVGMEAEDIVEGFEILDEYFDSLYTMIWGSSEEVMFDGDEYLVVNRNWFDKNFEFEDGWKYKK